MGLQVAHPMLLEMDNQGAIDITNKWPSNDCIHHLDICYKFLPEFKEANLICCVWCPIDKNEADTLTKNLHGHMFSKHNQCFVGNDE